MADVREVQMSTIDVAEAAASDAAPAAPATVGGSRLAWSCPEPGLWTATEAAPTGSVYAGFVQRVGDGYVAVDGLGAGLGAFAALDAAQGAVAIAVATTLAPSIWMRQV